MKLLTLYQSHVYRGDSMLGMCQTLTNNGFNMDGIIFEVYDFTTGDFVGVLEYISKTDTWVSTTKYKTLEAHGLTKSRPPIIQCKQCAYSHRTDKAIEYWCDRLERIVSPWEPPHNCPCKKVDE